MSYDFRNRTASRATILNLIVKGVLAERNVTSLVKAYIDDMIDDWDSENAGTFNQFDPKDYPKLGVIEESGKLEQLIQDTYIARYRRGVGHPVSREQALDVFVYPQGFPEERVPREVAVEVAEALADHDAEEANAMREHMKWKAI